MERRLIMSCWGCSESALEIVKIVSELIQNNFFLADYHWCTVQQKKKVAKSKRGDIWAAVDKEKEMSHQKTRWSFFSIVISIMIFSLAINLLSIHKQSWHQIRWQHEARDADSDRHKDEAPSHWPHCQLEKQGLENFAWHSKSPACNFPFRRPWRQRS